MNIIIQSTTQPDKIKRMCKLGLENDIFHPNGMMQCWMEEPQKFHAMSIAYHQSMPIGIAILRKQKCPETGVNIAIYIETRYRRHGIGSGLVRKLKARAPNRNIEAWKDDDKSDQFYTSVGL